MENFGKKMIALFLLLELNKIYNSNRYYPEKQSMNGD
jgi:hypothetical protein